MELIPIIAQTLVYLAAFLFLIIAGTILRRKFFPTAEEKALDQETPDVHVSDIKVDLPEEKKPATSSPEVSATDKKPSLFLADALAEDKKEKEKLSEAGKENASNGKEKVNQPVKPKIEAQKIPDKPASKFFTPLNDLTNESAAKALSGKEREIKIVPRKKSKKPERPRFQVLNTFDDETEKPDEE